MDYLLKSTGMLSILTKMLLCVAIRYLIFISNFNMHWQDN